jgi:hypothetical protein
MYKVAVFLMGCSMVFGDMPMSKDCSTMAPNVEQFAMKMTPQNRAMFCSQFTDGQRASAMQLAQTPDENGNTMSPDDAVQKVAGKKATQGKTPTGCPVQ